MSVSDLSVLITGGASGIGFATAEVLLERGAAITLADVRPEALNAAVRDLESRGLGAKVAAAVTDVRNFAQVETAVAKAASQFGRLDALFNNAGIGVGKPLLEHDPETDWDPVIGINQTGVYYGILAAARQFVRQGGGGTIVNTASIYGHQAAELVTAYSAAKAAVMSLTRSAAFELAAHGVRVVGIAPGRVRTPILAQFPDELNAYFATEQLRGELTEPREIGTLVAFLMSEEANAVNGTTVFADDGYASFKMRLPVG